MKTILTALALAAAVTAAPAVTADVTVGDSAATNGNCYPFGCFGSIGGTAYQTVYSATAFNGPITIDSISFFKATNTDDRFPDMKFNVSFYLTQKTVGETSNIMADNRGTLLADFGSFDLSGTVPSVLTLDGTNFTYDPSQGNLVLDMGGFVFGANSGNVTYFKQDDFTQLARRVFSARNYTSVGANPLVTRFNSVSAAAVPEPAAWSLMILGFAAVGYAMRRRNAAFKLA